MRRLEAVIALASLLVAGAARAAPAADAERCANAYESTQRSRAAGKLLQAEKEALECAADACPRGLRQECSVWVDETRRAIPTIVVRAIAADGCDLVSAEISVDGARIGEGRRGSPIPLDPGAHVVRAEAPGAPPVEQRILTVAGEHDRRVDLSAAPAGRVCTAPGAPAPDQARLATAPPAPHTSPIVYVLGVFGIASLTGGAIVGINGFSRRSELDRCSPACDPDDVASARRTFIVSDVLLGAGAVSLAAAAYLYLSGSSHGSAAQGGPGTVRF